MIASTTYRFLGGDGHQQHLGARGRELQSSGRVDGGASRHTDVHQDHLRLGLGGEGDRAGGVLSLPDDLEAARLQVLAKAATEEGVVVDDQDPNAGSSWRLVCSTPTPTPAQAGADASGKRSALGHFGL